MAHLKVYRTAIGFHDAYVAAPSQKAALAAWGADSDLFAGKLADQVNDPKLMELPLSRPGDVIRVARGSEQEHFRALSRTPAPSGKKGRGREEEPGAPPKAARKAVEARPPAKVKRSRPRPSRAALEAAEAALLAENEGHASRLAQIAEQERVLKEEAVKLREGHEARSSKLLNMRDKAQAAYHRKIELWAAQ